MSEQPTTREALAAYAHSAWSGWMEYLFKQGTTNSDGSFTIRAASVERWVRQMRTPYADLPEVEKRSDRAEADCMLAIFTTTTTDDAPHRAAPTAAPAAAGLAPTSPAEAGRQRTIAQEEL